MSSTTGSQNLLTNVFRPAYRYEIPVGGSTAVFVPSLDVSNVDVLTANSVTAFTAAIGDENENVYVGSNAGNSYSNLQGCSNNTAVGFAAASFVSNVANSVYIGYNAGAGAADSSVNIAIGPNTKGNGISNIYIGSNTGSLGTGSNNILIGHNLTGSNLSNTLLIGPTPTIYGNLNTRKVGIGRDPSYNMDISGDSRISYRLGVGMAPGTAENVSNLPHALDVSGYSYIKGGLGVNADPADFTFNVNGNFRVADGFGAMILQQDGSGNSVLTCKPDTTDVSGRKFIFNVVGDICASAFIVPGASFAGNVTASNVIATADLSGASAHATNIYGTTVFGTDVSGTTARFGSLFASSFNPASVTTTTVSVANGSVSTPSITFSNDVSSGVYLPAASNIAFTTAGVERMRISNTHVGIGTAVPRSALDVSTNIRAGTPGNTANTARLEVGGGYVGDGTASTNSYPTLAFQYGDGAGGYRHFVRTRHQAATTSVSNALDFFTNNSATATTSTAPGTGNLLGLSITSGGVGVGMSNPTVALDVSGAVRSTATTSNSLGGVTLSNTNLTLAGTITGSTANTSNVIGGVVLSNNNVSNSGTHTSSNFIGTSSASNSIGGVTLSNTNLTLAGTITGSTANTSNVIGGVVLSNNNVSNSGTHTSSNFIGSSDTASNRIGGITISNGLVGAGTSTPATQIHVRATSTVTTTPLELLRLEWADTGYDQQVGGGTKMSFYTPADNNLGTTTEGVSIAAVRTDGTEANTTNDFVVSTRLNGAGAVAERLRYITFSNQLAVAGDISTSGGVVSGFLRNALTPSTYDISAGNISNSATTRSSNFFGRGTASNSIAGVVLSNGAIRIDGSDTFMVAIGESTNTLATSTNGITWTSRGKTIFTSVGRGVAWNGSLWVAVGNGTNTIATSTDGITWTGLGSIIFSTQANSIAWGNVWVATGVGTNTLAYSPDGSNWTGIGTSIFSSGGNFAAWNGNIWVAVGGGTNTLAYSYDGSNWTGLGTSIFSSGGNGVAWNGSIWVAVGSGGNAFATSPDGINWTGRGGTGVFSTAGIAVAWNGSLWVAGGQGTNTLAYSSDGSNWTGAGASIFTTNGRCVAWNGYVWAAGGQGTNSLAYSFDGSNWTGAGTGALNLLTRGVAGRRYVLPVTDPHTGEGDIIFGGSIVGSNSGTSNQIGGTTLSNSKVGVATTNPIYEIDVSGQGATLLLGGVSRTPGTDGLLIQGYSNSGYIRPQLTGSVLYLGASNSNTVAINAAFVGINKGASYALDISASPGTNAAININTWPRIDNASNMTIVRGTVGIIGNTINWSNAQQNTISTNLMTLVLSNAAGCSFKVNKSGVWSISWMLGVSNGFSSWIDASTNENSNVALNTTGTYLISYAQAESGTLSSGSWTGYLPSNSSTFYKVRTNSAALTLNSNSNYFMATFLSETSNAGGNFPFR
jgi:hypothetical protein